MDDETREKIAKASRQIANEVADLLQQEYRWHQNNWWLFSLGRPQRVLTNQEILEASFRGQIPSERSGKEQP